MTQQGDGTDGKGFDQAGHWRQRGDRYVAEIEASGGGFHDLLRQQEAEFADLLASLPLDGVRSVLEIGCGYGRMTPVILDALPNVERYVCMDISHGQAAAARAGLQEHPQSDRIGFVVSDVQSSTVQVKHDLVFAIEVLLHFPPEVVPGAVRSMQELAGSYFIHIDPYEAYKESPLVAIRGRLRELYRRLSGNQLTTDWLHPYLDLYDRGSMVEVTSHPVLEGRQHVFIVEQAVEESASEIGSGGSEE